jgi:chromosome segregation ATPase
MDAGMCEMQANDAINILTELLNNGHITEEMFEVYKAKLNRTLDAIAASYAYKKQGNDKYYELKQNLINEKVKLEQAHNAQNENHLILNDLTTTWNMAKNELCLLKEKDLSLDEKLTNFEEEKAEKRSKITAEQNKAKMAIQPQKDKIKAQITELRAELARTEDYIKKEEEAQLENNERKENLIKENNLLKEEIEEKEEDTAKIKDEPAR